MVVVVDGWGSGDSINVGRGGRWIEDDIEKRCCGGL
jgi:hypothetical protein